jgi:hypothetical protein
MNKKTIGFLCIVMGGLLTGCGEWKNTSLSNKNSPMKSGESFVFSGTCYILNGVTASCDDVKVVDTYHQFESVTRQFCNVKKGSDGSYFTEVGYILKPYPLEPGIADGTRSIAFECIPSTIAAGEDWFNIYARFARPIIITPASATESMIILAPGQQQQLTVRLSKLNTQYSIGSKFIIVESQDYISFVGNQNSCTIYKGQSSCSVTVQANSNITTPVTRTLQVVTSEFPTESVFIKIAPSEPKYIFVSQSTTAGNFGGFAAADAICNSDGAKTTYPTQLGNGTFKALLNGNNATTVGTNYLNLAGESIAVATTTNLVEENAGLINPIGKTPSGIQDGQYAWTGLASTNTPAVNCTNWTSSVFETFGTAGYVSMNTAAWSVTSNGGTGIGCDFEFAHLYCVQQ